MHEFKAWPKTTRLFRDIIVTEKLDGTNSAIHITAVAQDKPGEITVWPGEWISLLVDGEWYVVSAQSRKRIISPGKTTDNYGFARWVYDNAEQLVRVLGVGTHFGEWWGKSIQRGYGLDERRFSLFNTTKARELDLHKSGRLPVGTASVDMAPVLYEGMFGSEHIEEALYWLQQSGSVAAPGFMNPEGVCVYHTASRQVSKVTLDANDAGKWEA
jgi:hypothetical protein